MNELHLTFDFEDPTFAYDSKGRYLAMARRLLDFCDRHKARATFFTVGRIALAAPAVLREIAARGHEIAYHTHAHLPLTQEHPEIFFREAYVDKDRLEQITGMPVLGFRAPCYSLTGQTLWAIDRLQKLGFAYSSSLMPTRFSRYGLANAPRTAFRWPNGMAEFPVPVKQFAFLRFAYLGGIYLYALPFDWVCAWAHKAPSGSVLWTYAHPYDFDREEPFTLMPHTPAWISLILWLGRRRASKQMDRLLDSCSVGLPLGFLATNEEAMAKLPTFTPSQWGR